MATLETSPRHARPNNSSHSHSHHHDNSYLVSQNGNEDGVKITRIGLYVNLGMAIGKGIGGYAFNSQVLIADGIHSLTDLVSDVMTLATVSWSQKPPSNQFPNGYGKIESFGSLCVSGILLSGGLTIGCSSIFALLQQLFPDFTTVAANWGSLHDHHHHHYDDDDPDFTLDINAIWIAAASMIVKEWLYHATLRVAKELDSNVLKSNAYHHRVDGLMAFVALLMIVASCYLSNGLWIDSAGGLIISWMIVHAGWIITKSSFLELLDASFSKEMDEKVRLSATQALDSNPESKDAVEIRHIQGTKSGQNLLLDIDMFVPGGWTVEQTCAIEDAVRLRLGNSIRGIKRFRIRFISR